MSLGITMVERSMIDPIDNTHVGILLADPAVVAMTASTPKRTAELHRRLAGLSQRWLPMLLNRAGVEIDLLVMLRSEIEDDPEELRRRLESARHIVREISRGSEGEVMQWANSSDDVISSLLRALELSGRNPAAAERVIARANRRLFGLLVGHPSPLPRPTPWWARLFAGRSDVRASAS